MRSLFERWDEKVERVPGGCWLWRGAIKDTGYGVLQRGRRGQGLVRAHRFAYEHFVGPVPDGLELRHSCDVRHCVNPAHLSVGTRADNMRDMVERGRWTPRPAMRGERNGNARLTTDQALAIRQDMRTLREIARDFGVSISTASLIRRGSRWAHASAAG
jgi:hypothetical protein